jgi:spore germination protein GerM
MKRTLGLALILLPVLVISGFYLRALVRRTFFENRPRPEAEMQTQLKQEALQAESSAQVAVSLYFPDYDTGSLVSEGRQMALAPNDADRIRQIVLALTQGSQQTQAASALPPSAVLRAVFLTSDGVAYLDFSNDFSKDLPAGIESETLAIYSLVDSLAANIPVVKRVKFLIQGQEADTLDGHVDLTGLFTPNMAWAAPQGGNQSPLASVQPAVSGRQPAAGRQGSLHP